MTKNITLSVPDDVFSKMNKLNEVNWSAVAREAIEIYIQRRDSPDLTPILERLTKEKSKEFTDGMKKATEIMTTKSYDAIDTIFVRYDKAVDEALKKEKEKRGKQPSGIMVYSSYDPGYPPLSLPSEAFYKIMRDVVADEVHSSIGRTTTEFARGLYEGLWEWKKKIDDLKV